MNDLKKTNILSIGVTNAKKQDILEFITKSLQKKGEKYYIVTPNPEIIMLSREDKDYENILNGAKIALADGVGLMIAAKIMGTPLEERFTGVELVEMLCSRISEKLVTVGFLGGRGGVAEKAAECLKKKYPKLKIYFVGEEWGSNVIARQSRISDDARLRNQENQSLASASLSKSRLQSKTHQPIFSSSENALLRSNDHQRYNNLTIEQFNNRTIDILFVAFGAPKQEKWIYQNLDKLPVKIAVGVGGAFDYLSGRIPRAPRFLRDMGLEWLFRLILQPWRIKRQLALLRFALLIILEKLGIRNHKIG